ncbi:MAG: FKBP-type peptidyl-prolyl cis-trans isomerase [Crocinitomicaceae bacterium]|nr:FKBP-type peptidyl-prolyl cis-trans isomerase [Crocinitomicaceae bacterium]
MKKTITLLAAGLILLACGEKERDFDENGMPYPDVVLTTFEERLSYGLGADMGSNSQNMPEEMFMLFDKGEIEEGFVSGMKGEDGDRPECDDILQSAFSSPEGIDTTANDMMAVSNCYGFILGNMTRKSLESKDALEMVDIELAKKGFAHALCAIDTLIAFDERAQMIADFNNDMNKKKGEKMMENARSLPNAVIGNSGYVLIEEIPGTGAAIDPTMEYKMIYTMMNANGDTLMSTVSDPMADSESNSLEIAGADIVEGWKLATEHMTVGGKYSVYLPYELAYGEKGLPSPRGDGYYINPYTGLIISSQILAQQERNSFAIERGEKVIEIAKQKPNTKVGASGYVLETLEEGTGPKVKPGSDVQAHYILMDSRGEVIENSYMGAMQGRPAPIFSLNGVIKGWQEGVPEMKKGGRYRLYVPYNLAYGETGNQGIPPYETLTFEMEILNFGEAGSLQQANPMMGGM